MLLHADQDAHLGTPQCIRKDQLKNTLHRLQYTRPLVLWLSLQKHCYWDPIQKAHGWESLNFYLRLPSDQPSHLDQSLLMMNNCWTRWR